MTKQQDQIAGIQRTILDNLNTAVLLLDQKLCIQYLNPSAESLLHISNKRATDLPLDKLIFVSESFMARLQDCLNNHHPFAEHEVMIDVYPGRKITIDYMVNPLKLSEDFPVLLIEISHMDRHLRIAREEKLLNEQIATRNLVRGMAHEIKNPLGGLRGAAQLLERELPNEELREYTGIIIGEADRLQKLVDRMLGPNNVPKRRNINIHQVLEHVRQLVQAEGHEGVYFKLDYDPSLPDLMADPDMLIQAVLNITRNALNALGNNGEITFRTRPQRHFTIGHKYHRLVLETDIIDNGPGIPEELQEQIFYPMVTGRADGTGLGLSIAQSLINQHGGLIEFTSRPGKTVFTIYLPLETADA
ncbi:MAG: nitrogen regulation protein NR(II) [Gammaproteobacteria bacterium]|nr:MAG: nitrogen regulation protein NR(II) [Gammaproteobacteria bacterium]